MIKTIKKLKNDYYSIELHHNTLEIKYIHQNIIYEYEVISKEKIYCREIKKESILLNPFYNYKNKDIIELKITVYLVPKKERLNYFSSLKDKYIERLVRIISKDLANLLNARIEQILIGKSYCKIILINKKENEYQVSLRTFDKKSAKQKLLCIITKKVKVNQFF